MTPIQPSSTPHLSPEVTVQVLVVGGGGREHALCWKLAQSPQVEKVFVAPGNAGCEGVAKRVKLQPNQITPLADFVQANNIDLTVVGPEAPLCAGLVDKLEKQGHKAFGPKKEAARLEGSKTYTKSLARQHNIPTPDFKIFQTSSSALDYLERAGDYPLVVKADGLAAGKGVRVCANAEEAREQIWDCMERGQFGEAGNTILIEDFVRGTETSVMVLVGGSTLLILEPARDYKAAYDGDAGPNTGGMGAYSPAHLDPKTMSRIEAKILVPTAHAMVREGHPFQGLLFAGLMLTPTGPRLLEYNVRFGDPETQPTMVRLKSDLLPLLLKTVTPDLESVQVEWDARTAVTVTLASEGYPRAYKKGLPITGIEAAEEDPDVVVFHGGTEWKAGRLVTSGGRVLYVTALGETVGQARAKAYEAVKKIRFDGMMYRTDIALGVDEPA